MTDKELDKLLKGTLEEYQPDYIQSSWKELENRIENEVEPSLNDPFDNAVKAALGQFAASNSSGNWEEMERRIVEDENVSFDQEVRENVSNYQAPYNEGSWPVLDEKITADQRFRRRLIGAKILEIAAILIALITFVNVFPDIKNSLLDKQESPVLPEATLSKQFVNSDNSVFEKIVDGKDFPTSDQIALEMPAVAFVDVSGNSIDENLVEDVNIGVEGTPLPCEIEVRNVLSFAHLPTIGFKDQQLQVEHGFYGDSWISSNITASQLSANNELSAIGVIGLPNQLDPEIVMALPSSERIRKKKSVRFNIGASMDLNALYIPEEHFYASGKHISFSEKNLLATGYSAGIGLLFGDGIWSFETGAFYSSKKYEPNRIIQIGKTFDVRTVDFSEISLHIISVPLYAHWNFDRKGKTRFYGVIGAGVNLIADAHYDLITRNSLRSGPSGVIPDKNTDNEVERIREHILDGAKFSSKSYITAVAGFGVEHQMGEKLSFFAQPMYNYQVPFFQFSDQNGKQFQYLSMQLGTRVRLR